MSLYSKRMAYTFASLGLLWLSPFGYWLVKRYLPATLNNFVSDQEALIIGLYVGLAGVIFLFGKAWAYWGQAYSLNKAK